MMQWPRFRALLPFGPGRSARSLSTDVTLRRSYLYVPASSERMLQKSLNTESDVIIYDLEDSVAPNAKVDARRRLSDFLASNMSTLGRERVAVRVNDTRTEFFYHDIEQALRSSVGTLVLPKVHFSDDLHTVSSAIERSQSSAPPVQLVASIESARAMYNLGSIASFKSSNASVLALLFAAEDYCADTSIIRTPSRQELLFTRSQIVITAKAFGLQAIDMVCVNYKDHQYLQDECKDGRQLGFNGKQAIHPSQVETIQKTFVPTPSEILRAAKILHGMQAAHSAQTGAVGLDGEMIDAPMLKQAESTIAIAKAAKLEIPNVE